MTALLFAVRVQAQASTGQITGVVRDAAGAALEGATVRVTNQSTDVITRATAAAGGRYSVSGLRAGAYTVRASMIGLQAAIQRDVQVAAAAVKVDLVLQKLTLAPITVSAMLREQNIGDVPISIAAPTSADLRSRGVENIEGIAANVAGFSVQNLGPGQSQVAIRGASSGQIARDQPGVKEQVGAYLDDAPISLSLFTPDLDLFDIGRVEVLRGPQGTLFGAGSLSGTVRYISNQPEIGQSSVFGEVGSSTISNGGAGVSAKLGYNMPISNQAAARIVGYYSQTGGFIGAVQPGGLNVNKNVNSGTRSGVRASLQFNPSDRFSITPRVVYQRVHADGWNRIDAFNILGNPWTTTRPAVTLGERQQFTQIAEPYSDDFILADLKLKYDFGATNLTSITSYTHRSILVVRDAGALTSSITGGSIGLPASVYTLNSPLNDATGSTVLTQELRLAGVRGSVNWVVGGFYSTNRRKYGQSLLVSGFQAASGIPTAGLRAPKDVLFYSDLAYDLKQFALFGEATVTVNPKFSVTAGARYYNFSEDRAQIFDGIFGNDNNGTALVSTPGSTNANGFVPRVMANYAATDATSIHAQVSQGFRLGGINDPLNIPLCTPADKVTFGGRDSWKNESAWNYEVGTRTRMAGGRASLNVSVFDMELQDLQLTVTAGSCSSRLIFNVPKARSQGLEVEFTATPDEHFDFSVSGSFTDAKLQSTVTSTSAAGVVSVVGGIQSGNRLPSVPQAQAAAVATYKWRAGNEAIIALTGSVNYVGSRYTQIGDEAAGAGTVNLNSFGANTIGGPLTQSTFTYDPLLPAYSLANLRLAYERDQWEVALYLNNLGDTRAFLALDQERGTRARVGYLTNQPRTIGLNFSFHH